MHNLLALAVAFPYYTPISMQKDDKILAALVFEILPSS
jgi:hypothetical protein